MNKIKKLKEIRNKLKNKKPSIGSWMQICDSDVAEIFGFAGYDWIAIDLEHGLFDKKYLSNIFRSLELGNTLPLARVESSNFKDLKYPMEAGAAGVIVPMIKDTNEVKYVVDNVKWPPAGSRGVGFSRANLYGKKFNNYSKLAIDPFVVIQIENIQAVNNLESILNNVRVDAVLIGPYDLSASLGKVGQFKSKTFLNTINEITKICKKNEVPYGSHIISPEKKLLTKSIKSGNLFIPYSIDTVIMNKYFTNPIDA